MATILPLAQQFFDATGGVLAGGSLTFYVNETLTLATIFTTQNEGVQLPNPLTLTSEGRLPSASVWCNGDYRVILKDSDGVQIFDIDDIKLYNPFDWTGLTATIADINAISGSLGTPGTVVASKAVVVDASKNIATFGTLSASHLNATTAIKTPQINDANDIVAITIPPVSSQVNAITVTPTVASSSPSIKATGADSNIDLKLAGKGTGAVLLSGIRYPVSGGTVGQVMTSDGAGVLALASIPVTSQIVKQVVSSSTTTMSAITSVIPKDDTIPQITEGTEVLTVSITPTSASSTLLVFAVGQLFQSVVGIATQAIFRDATANALAASFIQGGVSNQFGNAPTTFVSVAASSTSATTFRLRVGPSTGTATVNGSLGARLLGGSCTTSLIVVEI